MQYLALSVNATIPERENFLGMELEMVKGCKREPDW